MLYMISLNARIFAPSNILKSRQTYLHVKISHLLTRLKGVMYFWTPCIFANILEVKFLSSIRQSVNIEKPSSSLPPPREKNYSLRKELWKNIFFIFMSRKEHILEACLQRFRIFSSNKWFTLATVRGKIGRFLKVLLTHNLVSRNSATELKFQMCPLKYVL